MSKHTVAALNELSTRLTKSIGKYQNTHAASIVAEQQRLVKAMDGLASMRENPSSLETPSAHTLKLIKSASKLKDEAAKIKAKVYQNYQQYAFNLVETILARGNVVESKYAAEIRTAYNALPQDQRMSFIQQMIDKLDGASFAAIMQAPEILTGINPEMNRNLTDAYYLKAAPDIYQEQQDLKDAMDCIDASMRTVESDLMTYQDGAALQRIEQEVQRSQEASDKFNAAIVQS